MRELLFIFSSATLISLQTFAQYFAYNSAEFKACFSIYDINLQSDVATSKCEYWGRKQKLSVFLERNFTYCYENGISDQRPSEAANKCMDIEAAGRLDLFGTREFQTI